MIGKTFTFLVLVAATAAIGYAAWETRNLRAILDRMTVGNETNITEMMISQARTETQLAKMRETVDLLSGSGADRGADVAALEGKITSTLTAAQREVLQQELKKWARQIEERSDERLAALRKSLEQKLSRNSAESEEGDKRWAELKALVQDNHKTLATRLKALDDGLSTPSGDVKQQRAALTNLEKRLAAVVEAAEESQKALTRRDEVDDKRWKELRLELKENKEATQQRYAELAARLDRSRAGGGEPAGAAGGEQSGQSPGPAVRTDEEQLAEFCAEVPQSALCQNR